MIETPPKVEEWIKDHHEEPFNAIKKEVLDTILHINGIIPLETDDSEPVLLYAIRTINEFIDEVIDNNHCAKFGVKHINLIMCQTLFYSNKEIAKQYISRDLFYNLDKINNYNNEIII